VVLPCARPLLQWACGTRPSARLRCVAYARRQLSGLGKDTLKGAVKTDAVSANTAHELRL